MKRIALLALAWIVLPACDGAPPPSLVMISVDTVRQDHLPTYGYDRPTMPAVDRLARRGVAFTNAFTQEVNTAPSHASMFTGLYPHQHGSVSNAHPLASGPTTLAEVLRTAGFRTAGFVSGLPMRRRITALDRGFETWDDSLGGKRRDGAETTRRALAWLEARDPGERFFLFLHLYDPHGPYTPPESHRALFDSPEPGRRLDAIPRYQRLEGSGGEPLVHLNGYVDRYDALLRYADDQVARVVGAVDPERTLVVFLSDHGETLGERHHVLDHGSQLFDEQIRIPLVLAGPGVAPARVSAPAETVDLMPTLLELLGIPAPDGSAGRSLVPALAGGADPASWESRESWSADGRPVHATARAMSDRHADRGYRLRRGQRMRSIRTGSWKLIRYPGVDEDPVELYDLENDPGETRDVAAEHPEVRDAYLAALDAWYRAEEAEAAELPEDVREALRALGYLE